MYEPSKTAKIIKNVANLKGVKISDMLVECNLNKNALSFMQSRGSWLQANNLAKIADYLDCSVDYLLGRTESIDSHKLHVERTDIIMDKYIYRLHIDEKADVNLNDEGLKDYINRQLNYGWKFIKIEEENDQYFFVLEWEKEGIPNIAPIGKAGIRVDALFDKNENDKLDMVARSTDKSVPIKPDIKNLDDFPTMDEE